MKSAQIRDYVDESLAAHDFLELTSECPYSVGNAVLLRKPECHQKHQAPYESGWTVKKVVSPSTVVIARASGVRGEKVVHVGLLKRDPVSANPEAAKVLSPQDMDIVQAEETADWSPVMLEFSPESDSRRYCLCDCSGLHAPARYSM